MLDGLKVRVEGLQRVHTFGGGEGGLLVSFPLGSSELGYDGSHDLGK